MVPAAAREAVTVRFHPASDSRTPSNNRRRDSDLDVAVYGSSGRRLEIETERQLAGEADMQLAVERATNRNVDLLVLNRAPASVCAVAISSGVPLFVRDGSGYSRYFLAVTSTAIDFLETEADWREIPARLERITDFLQDQLTDARLIHAVVSATHAYL